MVIFEYSGPSHRENYARVVAVEFGLQRAFFHGVTDFRSYSITAKLLTLYTHKRILSEPQDLVTVMGSHCQPYIWCGAQVHTGLRCQSVLSTEAIAEVG